MRRWRWDFEEFRRWFLLILGGAGVLWETIVNQVDRPSLVVLFALMMGLPALGWSAPPRSDGGEK